VVGWLTYMQVSTYLSPYVIVL